MALASSGDPYAVSFKKKVSEVCPLFVDFSKVDSKVVESKSSGWN